MDWIGESLTSSPSKMLKLFGLHEVSVHAVVKEGDAAALHRLLGQWEGSQAELHKAINDYDENGGVLFSFSLLFSFPLLFCQPTPSYVRRATVMQCVVAALPRK